MREKLSRDLIARAGFSTQRELADYVDMSEEHISRLVNGRKETPRILVKLLETRAALNSTTPSEDKMLGSVTLVGGE